ncbi:BadF/BadG/BcrA/BcrD ATPase family protein [uncultured Gimesia sp.]|uniref:N-acetylglucosamine kinase n=1 Tax=uncultured Gimesia sp. TaxID=1678688 RepID=UPI002620553D|nr:BadF/BadG/BcrA/BcrD ATPase family protein [uncultured Gimesia sp.]
MSLQSEQLVLGIDGGGSKTRASLARVSSGNEIQIAGWGISGASNLNATGLAAAAEQVQLAIQRAFEAAEIPFQIVAAISMGMSGAGRDEERQAWLNWAQENNVADRIQVVTDAETVLAAGTPEGFGLALIAGTGSLAFGKNKTGAEARAGGWGYLLGDEGGGYQIAIAAIKAILKSADGRCSETSLRPAVLQSLGLEHSDELIGFVYRSENNRREIAELSKLVFAAAEKGDQVALKILQHSVEELSDLVKAVVNRLEFSGAGYALALTGGILIHQQDFRLSLCEHLSQLQIEPSTIECVDDASLGAVRIAVGLLNDGV